MRCTTVPPEISRSIGQCGLTRNGVVRVITDLHAELPEHYPHYQQLRHPEDDRLFFYFAALADGDLLHEFTFCVDDNTSPDHLIITDVEHESRPLHG